LARSILLAATSLMWPATVVAQMAGAPLEIAGDRGLAASGWLKIDRIGGAHCRRDIHPAVLDRFRAGDAELVNAAIILNPALG
jgi:hypothetical protein